MPHVVFSGRAEVSGGKTFRVRLPSVVKNRKIRFRIVNLLICFICFFRNIAQSVGPVQRDPGLPDGVRRIVGHRSSAGAVVRRRRGSGYRQFRAEHALGIPHVRVRQPVPSGAAQLSPGIRTGRRGIYSTVRRAVRIDPAVNEDN